MNWIRDNIVKILIVLGVCVLLVIVIIIWSSFAGGKSNNSQALTSYSQYESKAKNATISYASKEKSILPKNGEVVKIGLETLVNKKYMNPLTAIENKNVKCSGYVEIVDFNQDNTYRYTPFIKCGDYYESKSFSSYLLEKEKIVTSGDGLYKRDNYYVFRGNNPNNRMILGNYRYRILGITEEGYLKVVSTTSTSNSYLYDKKYNSENKKFFGINYFKDSKLNESLNNIYKNKSEDSGEKVYVTDDMRDYVIEHDFCVGRRKEDDFSIYSPSDCSETVTQKIGIITLSDYYGISTDKGCNEIKNKECHNYNYLYNYQKNTFLTSIGSADISYHIYLISGGSLYLKNTNTSYSLYPVFYIDNNIHYISGDGTGDNPYKIN